MTDTELKLLAAYRMPCIPLERICEQYFGLAYPTACVKAAKNELPVRTFRLAESTKSPLMVHTKDLAQLIDQRAA